MKSIQQERLSEMKKMINNPLNAKILILLDDLGRLYLGDICKELKISPIRGLKHVGVLKEMKLIEKAENSSLIQLNRDQYQQARILLSTF